MSSGFSKRLGVPIEKPGLSFHTERRKRESLSQEEPDDPETMIGHVESEEPTLLIHKRKYIDIIASPQKNAKDINRSSRQYTSKDKSTNDSLNMVVSNEDEEQEEKEEEDTKEKLIYPDEKNKLFSKSNNSRKSNQRKIASAMDLLEGTEGRKRKNSAEIDINLSKDKVSIDDSSKHRLKESTQRKREKRQLDFSSTPHIPSIEVYHDKYIETKHKSETNDGKISKSSRSRRISKQFADLEQKFGKNENSDNKSLTDLDDGEDCDIVLVGDKDNKKEVDALQELLTGNDDAKDDLSISKHSSPFKTDESRTLWGKKMSSSSFKFNKNNDKSPISIFDDHKSPFFTPKKNKNEDEFEDIGRVENLRNSTEKKLFSAKNLLHNVYSSSKANKKTTILSTPENLEMSPSSSQKLNPALEQSPLYMKKPHPRMTKNDKLRQIAREKSIKEQEELLELEERERRLQREKDLINKTKEDAEKLNRKLISTDICEIIDVDEESIDSKNTFETKVSHKKLFTYPEDSKVNSITVFSDDFRRLDDEVLLNDTVIEFYLNYIYNELITSDTMVNSYIFNTFFYSKLSSMIDKQFSRKRNLDEFKEKLLQSYEKDSDVALQDKLSKSSSSSSVSNFNDDTKKDTKSNSSDETSKNCLPNELLEIKKWTEKINGGLFRKKYLIIPINEDYHWYLAIVYNPYALIDEEDDSDMSDSNISIGEYESVDSPPLSQSSIKNDLISKIDDEPTDLNNDSTMEEIKSPTFEASRSNLDHGFVESSTEVIPSTDSNVDDNVVNKADYVNNVSATTEFEALEPINGNSNKPGTENKEDNDEIDVDLCNSNSLGDEVMAKNLQTQFNTERPRRSTRGRTINLEHDSFFTSSYSTLAKSRTRKQKMTMEQRKKLSSKCIVIILDSLKLPHNKTVRKLKMFLELEALLRFPEKVFNMKKLEHFHVPVPSQNNLSDCGVFLLNYVEKFLKNPSLVFSQLVYDKVGENWFESNQIKEKRKEIKRLMLELSGTNAKLLYKQSF